MDNPPPVVLIVDDEPDIRELLEITLMRMGLGTDTAADVQTALRKLKTGTFALCLTDMRLPDGTGMEVLDYVQKHCPTLPIAMITAHGNMDTAIEALKSGAFDFVSKPVELDRLRTLVHTALKLGTASATAQPANPDIAILGTTEAVENLRIQSRKLGRSQAPVFISGESGSGKELVARLIHASSPRADKPFVPVNCGAIPADLMESEFFGHKKGSFTGATEDKKGLFQAAEGGTLFLDEVADLPLPMQVKLLRVIQEKAVRPVGGHEERSTDVRILSATHKNLAEEVNAGRFRNDLFFRINVIELKVPPLRERREDILLIAEKTLERFAVECELPKAELSSEAAQVLARYNFPGNVRELENILERAFTLCEGNVIQAGDLHLSAEGHIVTTTAKSSVSGGLYAQVNPEEAFGSMDDYLANLEKDILLTALERVKWNKTAAANLLGISFRALRYKLKKYELD